MSRPGEHRPDAAIGATRPLNPAQRDLDHDAEIDLAHGLPDWDLLPPGEFIVRRRANPTR